MTQRAEPGCAAMAADPGGSEQVAELALPGSRGSAWVASGPGRPDPRPAPAPVRSCGVPALAFRRDFYGS